ncbi:uncharacterized protein E0L32_007642 [Thyridium curvatum]|uniref:tRNA (adenine(58)-N(1))-methyltransferase non-catalytic subunit TRM6 n=1 Tax=Thyridium curvatum TaxID=1093900 RepID=A0A507AVB9_9PEZI|nr:uncharacterized protein E0L32_007642 [Thyridium curvatum]TPX11663.1 hypothetical protein E0L32_007642 [Thyridium curvatum]
MPSVVEPNAWVALRLPSEMVKVLQVVPNTAISLGKYGAFPSNLIIGRPYHLTYEILDKEADEKLSRLRVVPTDELYADIFADEAREEGSSADDLDNIITPANGVEYSLVDAQTNAVVAKSNIEAIDEKARQLLSSEDIEELKKHGANAGKDLVAQLMLSHTALDEKTSFSLSKYKILKTKKFIRRFSVSPLDPLALGNFLIDEKDVGPKILEMREEMVALLGCWANIHYGGEESFHDAPVPGATVARDGVEKVLPSQSEQKQGRWLVIDDTGGLLVAAMAERMGILYPENAESKAEQGTDTETAELPEETSESAPPRRKFVHRDDFHIPYARTNTITTIYPNTQANLAYLRYFGFDPADNNPPPHPLNTHLMGLTWLQLVDPDSDYTYRATPEEIDDETLATLKAARRGNYHRKRRRWARTRHIVNTARAGEYDGLVVATQMDPVSVLRHTLPLLAGGAPIAVYSPSVEYLSNLADCFSIARRTAWTNPADAPAETRGKSAEELERWQGDDEFPLNPTLVVAPSVQTSRARKWQVLPGRTHPVMSSKGGAEGYVFTAWRAMPAEGRIEARGRYKKRKVAEDA